MPLHCTLVRSPCAALQEPPVELTVDGPDGAAGADLQQELAARFATGKLSVDGCDVSSLTLGQPPLVHGAILVDAANATGRRSRERTPEPAASLALAVHSGAGAGLVVPLRRGSYTIGRSNADVSIPDPGLSRSHAQLVVTETAITLVDLDSANGTEVDGERRRNALITTNSTIRCGNSTMSLVFLAEPDKQLDQAGTDVHEPLVVRRRDDPSNRAALLLTAVVPVVIGVGLAVITGMWMFLAFTAVSVISILVPIIGGRRQRRELAAGVRDAVARDKERRRRAAPPLSALTLSGAAERDTTAPVDERGIWLRMGQAIRPANLRFEPPDPGRAVPLAGMLPVTLDPARPLTTVRGPRDAMEGMARSFLMQFAGYPRGRGSTVVVHGQADRLPLAARFLEDVTLSSRPGAVHHLLKRGFRAPHGHGVLILLSGNENTRIIEKALEHDWQVIHFSHEEAPLAADVELDERSSVFSTGTDNVRFVPDLAPEYVFDKFCRRRARNACKPDPANGSIPLSCRLMDLLPASTADITKRWKASSSRPGLAVPVGLNAGGVQMLDLQADGPHLLVAGTTGSGKSELLRSLTMALACSFPPDRINFLFVDFKGGSGLGPLTGVPHCVGMLTDLSSHELERYLQSLRAEIRFREEVLAAVQAPDLTSYQATPAGLASPLPHLVIVIDEFRMLVEDAPETLRELLRIAAIGRSLGIHLIMATQRPQGALTADIRANVTTSVALRVQSEMESTDIINSKAAAGISIDTPGRAYLVRGTEAPVEFQAGSLTDGPVTSRVTGLSVHLASDYIDAPPAAAEPTSGGTELTPAQAAAPLISSMSELWEAMNGVPVRKPVAPPLPCVLPEPSAGPASCPAKTAGGTKDDPKGDHNVTVGDLAVPEGSWSVRLGLMDLPSEQRTAPLIWDPAAHGHVGFVGGPESGAGDGMRLAVLRLASHRHESHLYILDPGSSLAGLSSHARVGARAGLHELRRAARILERLAEEQARRLADPAAGATPLTLVIAGWGSWASAFRSGPLAWAEDLVHDLIRDGGSAGITVVISGQRELVTARFFAAIPNRVYFPKGSSEESRIAWPKLPPTASVAGRGVAIGALSAGKTAVCQFYAASQETDGRTSNQGQRTAPAKRPFRVEPLPSMVTAFNMPGKTDAPHLDGTAGPLPDGAAAKAGHRPGLFFSIGVGGDELEPVSVRVPRGAVLAVLGTPSSGKSSFLRLLTRIQPDAGPWLKPEPETDPSAYWLEVLNRALAGSLVQESVAVVDDADLLPYEANRQLVELNALGTTVVMTAGFSPALSQRVPLALHARNLGTGVLIAPRTFLDGDLFGVRFETETGPPPGRSVVIRNGRALAVQLGWVPPDESLNGQTG